jgi:cytochrome P450
MVESTVVVGDLSLVYTFVYIWKGSEVSFMDSNDLSASSPEQPPALFPGFEPSPGRAAYYDEQRQAWQVFRYHEVQRVLSDFTNFSSNRGRLMPSSSVIPTSASMIELDPPRHNQLRSLVAQAFAPKAVAQLEPAIISLAHQLLDAVIDQGEMDVVKDFAALLPLLVICRLLGTPEEDRQQMRLWCDAYAEASTPAAWQARSELLAYFTDLIEQRRKIPQDDLVSTLLSAQVDGQHLSESEVANFCLLLILAGNETTKNVISNALVCFDAHPTVMAQIQTDPDLLPGAIEEVIRYLPPVPSFPRVARVDTVIEGQPVKAGQWVSPWIMSANRDPEQFADPDRFDIRRNPNPHISFGAGVHFCLGAPLARLEARIALAAMFERLTAMQRVRTVPLKPILHPVVYGVYHLPLTFRKKIE